MDKGNPKDLDPLVYTLHATPLYYPGGSPLTHLFEIKQFENQLEDEGYGRCLDIGHLVMRDKDPVLNYYENSNSIVNLHLHGVVEGNDHRQLEPVAGDDGICLERSFRQLNFRGKEWVSYSPKLGSYFE